MTCSTSSASSGVARGTSMVSIVNAPIGAARITCASPQFTLSFLQAALVYAFRRPATYART